MNEVNQSAKILLSINGLHPSGVMVVHFVHSELFLKIQTELSINDYICFFLLILLINLNLLVNLNILILQIYWLIIIL